MMTVYREDLRGLRETLDEYFETLIANQDLMKKVLKGGAIIWRLSSVALTTFFVGSVVNVFTPIMAITKQHKLHIHPIKYFLPNGSVYPWNVTPGGLLWKFHYVCETFSCYTLYAIANSVVSLFCLYVFQMISQLRAMSDRMLHLDESSDPDSIVRDCIHRYETLLKCRNDIEKIFGPVVYWLTITNAISMCLAIFQLSQV
uniref:Olfactory receptor 70 n=1 Tax=Meteorus pulchricornis TaxID=51522 RepID=A0A1S5VFR8_9HYME|nr:olfactory receptor 70 [Meteorus pulchricornis]